MTGVPRVFEMPSDDAWTLWGLGRLSDHGVWSTSVYGFHYRRW